MPPNPATPAKSRPSVKAQVAERLAKLEASGAFPAGLQADPTNRSDPFAVDPASAGPPTTTEPPSAVASADAIPPAPPSPPPSGAVAQPDVPDGAPPVGEPPAREADTTVAAEPPKAVDAPPPAPAAAPVPPIVTTPPHVEEATAPAAAADDYEDFTFEEGPGVSYSARVKRGESQRFKEAMLRRADYSRKTQQLGKWMPLLLPLVQDQRMDGFGPLIELATKSPDFAQAVSDVYFSVVNRGHPYAHLQQQQAAPRTGPAPDPLGQTPQAAPAPAPAPASQVELLTEDQIEQMSGGDPLAANIIRTMQRTVQGAVAPIASENAQLRQQLQTAVQRLDQLNTGWTGFQEQSTRREQEAQAARQREASRNQEAIQVANTFREMWPQEFNVDNQTLAQRLVEIQRYGIDSGFLTYDSPQMAGMLRAKYTLDQMRAQAAPPAATAPLAPVPSPAAALLAANAETERRARAAAVSAAANSTATAVGTGGSGAPPPPPAQKLHPPKLGSTKPNGQKVSLADQIEWTQRNYAALTRQGDANPAALTG